MSIESMCVYLYRTNDKKIEIMNPFPETTQDLKDNREDYISIIEESIEDNNWDADVKTIMKALVKVVNNPLQNNGDLDIYEMIDVAYSLVGVWINNNVVDMGIETRKNIAKYL